MHKGNVTKIQHGTFFSLKKKWNYISCGNMDETGVLNVRWLTERNSQLCKGSSQSSWKNGIKDKFIQHKFKNRCVI